MWKGDAIHCNDNEDEIIFLHSRFLENGNRNKTCNDGDVRGQSVGVMYDKYTSRLNVTLTSELIGKNIMCIHNTITLEEITSAVFTGNIIVAVSSHMQTMSVTVSFT